MIRNKCKEPKPLIDWLESLSRRLIGYSSITSLAARYEPPSDFLKSLIGDDYSLSEDDSSLSENCSRSTALLGGGPGRQLTLRAASEIF